MYSNNNSVQKDALQINMELISKELNDLVVTNEKDYGGAYPRPPKNLQITGQHPNNIVGCPPILSTPQALNNYQIPYMTTNQYRPILNTTQYPIRTYEQQHQFHTDNNVPSSYPYTTYSSNFNSPYARAIHYGGTAPSYLRPQAKQIQSPSLLSLGATDTVNSSQSSIGGSYKKSFSKSNSKHGLMTKNPAIPCDYKNVVIDLSVLGITKDGKEPNPVLRLFSLFRDLHIALGEQPPHAESSLANESVYVPTFAPLPKIVLPCTMSVQCQVKHATTQVATFLYGMKRLMTANIMYDQNLNAECELHVIKLRQMLAQFEMYKFIELKHKRGQFLNENIRVHAEHLEKIMEEMNHQIREVNLRVVACDWYIAKKYGRGMGAKNTKAATKSSTDTTFENQTEIGVINEILKLCEQQSSANVSADSSDIQTNSFTTITTSNNSTNAELSKVVGVNHSVTTTTAIGAECLSKCCTPTTTHARQPVFYIG
ncbi:bag of marbles [Musca autumnalis]|uniref:bag of marbles n=1 Tax=Musca autumnalis TaxID=221902 RepID=UPI003CF96D6A